jgi:hypothetical protein
MPHFQRRLILASALLSTVLVVGSTLDAAQPPSKKAPPKGTPATSSKPTMTSNGPAVTRLSNEAWANAPVSPTQPAEIDQLIAKELTTAKVEPAALTTDEQFIRRVTLDLTGHIPLPADVTEFVASKDSTKRAKLIDQLLESDEYARHWGRYWRDVIASKIVDRRDMILVKSFEEWMTKELKTNAKWDQITKAMLTADGEAPIDDPGKNGQAFFLAAHHGPDSANDRAAETSRVFLGIQIRCAQCHDHPFDQWKQVQFHELAAYYARLNEKQLRAGAGKPFTGVELFAKPQGEHEMSVKNDPNKTFTVNPKFLDGKAPAASLSDHDRRLALANSVIDKNNYWFAGAFVNRMWGELMGQSFYQPVDDMGPGKDVVFAPVLTRLAGSFRASNYDIKSMFRTILNTQAYQRQIRLGESTDQHLHFAASYPKQLNADALWESLSSTLGMTPKPADNSRPLAGAYGVQGGLEGEFKRLFSFDPSLKSDEVEGNIAQALLLMNNPTLSSEIQAKGNNVLARILSSYPKDQDAVEVLYLRTLARKPTERELIKCRAYVSKVGNRSEAFEDLMWALLNSTEYQSKR